MGKRNTIIDLLYVGSPGTKVRADAWVENELPDGGTAGQVLKKKADGTTEWGDDQAVPSGGTTGQVLTKTDTGADWEDINALPEGGTVGQVVKKTATGAEWADDQALPSGGTVGQVVKKTATGAEWADDQALPSGGTVGQVVKKTATGAEWADDSGISDAPSDGKEYVRKNASWVENAGTIGDEYIKIETTNPEYRCVDTNYPTALKASAIKSSLYLAHRRDVGESPYDVDFTITKCSNENKWVAMYHGYYYMFISNDGENWTYINRSFQMSSSKPCVTGLKKVGNYYVYFSYLNWYAGASLLMYSTDFINWNQIALGTSSAIGLTNVNGVIYKNDKIYLYGMTSSRTLYYNTTTDFTSFDSLTSIGSGDYNNNHYTDFVTDNNLTYVFNNNGSKIDGTLTNNVVYYSTDGGSTWQSYRSSTYYGLRCIHYINSKWYCLYDSYGIYKADSFSTDISNWTWIANTGDPTGCNGINAYFDIVNNYLIIARPFSTNQSIQMYIVDLTKQYTTTDKIPSLRGYYSITYLVNNNGVCLFSVNYQDMAYVPLYKPTNLLNLAGNINRYNILPKASTRTPESSTDYSGSAGTTGIGAELSAYDHKHPLDNYRLGYSSLHLLSQMSNDDYSLMPLHGFAKGQNNYVWLNSSGGKYGPTLGGTNSSYCPSLNYRVQAISYIDSIHMFLALNTSDKLIWYSEDDGATWTSVDVSSTYFYTSNCSYYKFEQLNNGVIYIKPVDCESYMDKIVHSTDGKNWVVDDLPTGVSSVANVFYDSINNNYKFIGNHYSTTSYICQSSDGLTNWTVTSLSNSNRIGNIVIFDGKYYSSSGYNQYLYSSTDLVTWTGVMAYTGGLMVFNNTLYICAAYAGFNYLKYTKDGTTWKSILSSTSFGSTSNVRLYLSSDYTIATNGTTGTSGYTYMGQNNKMIYNKNDVTDDIKSIILNPPTTAGTYKLTATVNSAGVVTYAWVTES